MDDQRDYGQRDYGDGQDWQSRDSRLETDPLGLRKRRGKRKVCKFCADPNLAIDYKDPVILRFFITERGKIVPRRISGNCALHQREVTTAVKRARNIALMPYTSPGG